MLSSPYLNDNFCSQSKIYSAVLPLPWPNQKREDAKTWPGFTLSLFLFLSLCVCFCVCERVCVFVCVLSPRATRDPVNLLLGFVAVFAWHIMSKNILTTPSQLPSPPAPISHSSWLQLLTLLQSIGRLPPSQVPETGMECRRGAPRHITYRSVQEEAAGLHGSDYCLEVGGKRFEPRQERKQKHWRDVVKDK